MFKKWGQPPFLLEKWGEPPFLLDINVFGYNKNIKEIVALEKIY